MHENIHKNNTPDIAADSASSKVDKAPRLSIYAKSKSLEPRTQAAWQKWLGLAKVEGDLERKARLMHAFQRGVDYVEAEAVKQKIGYERPAIGIITTERDDPGWPQGVGTSGGTHVYIAKWHLEEASQYNLEQPMTFFGKDKVPAYAGATVPDYFILFGVEEAHHVLFYQREGSWASSPLHPDTTLGAVYDAQDHEYEALAWQIKAARAFGFPEVTAETLQHRLQAATAVRREQAANEQAAAQQEATGADPAGTAEERVTRKAEGAAAADSHQPVIRGDTPASTETLRDKAQESLLFEAHGRGEDGQRPEKHLQNADRAQQDPLAKPTDVSGPPRLAAEDTPLADREDTPDPRVGPPQGNTNGTPGV